MKPARIFPLLLLALAAIITPRLAGAQTNDSIWFTNDCGSDPGFDWGFYNRHPEYVNKFLLIITPASVDAGFSFNNTSENTPADQSIWGDSVTATGDTAVYYAQNGGGDGTGSDDSSHLFILGGPGGSLFPDSLFNKEVTIQWESLVSGQGGQLVSSGLKTFIPTSYQGQCTFDSVSASATTGGCDVDFDFHVFNHNGPQAGINQIQFQIVGLGSASIEPCCVQAPPGWSYDSASQYIAYFSTSCGSSDQINYKSNLSGFIVPVRAISTATQFSWNWTASSCGSLIDADTVSVSATPPPCSETTNVTDSMNIINQGECNFQFNVKNYHNDADTVSPLTSYTLTITNPGVTWSAARLPPQAIPGTWQYSGVGTNTLNFHELSKYFLYGQSGGTIWTPGGSLDNPDNIQNIFVQWSDSNASIFESSGTDTTGCSNGLADTAWVVPASGCDYTLFVWNSHTHPTSSLGAFAMTIPGSAGSFTPSCFSTSNKWEIDVPGSSARFSNTSGASGFLKSGSIDTIHFCIDPTHSDSSWVLTWITYDSSGNNQLFTNTITVPGCSPPLVCDSIRHILNPNDCSDTIVVLNLRQGGAEVDTVIVAPSPGWNIDSADTPLFWQAAIESDGSVHFTTSSHAITPGLSQAFHVWYTNPDDNPFTVQVTSSSNGVECPNTATLECPLNGVSPSSVPQSLAASVVPNPMNDEADIMLTTGTFDHVQMTLMDVLGRTAKTVLDGTIGAGDHDYTLDVSQLPPGTYYLRIVASGATLTKKLVIEH